MPFLPSMLVDPTPMYPRRRRVKPKATIAPTPPGEPPLLIAAGMKFDDNTLSLTFDRDVNAVGLVGSAIIVDDPVNTQWVYVATGVAARPDARTAVLAMDTTVPADQGDRVVLNAGAGNGIVAVDGGMMWDGVGDVGLPFEQLAGKTAKKAKARATPTRRKRAA